MKKQFILPLYILLSCTTAKASVPAPELPAPATPVLPTPAPVVVAKKIATTDDINNISSLLTAYNAQSATIKSLQDIALNNPITPTNLPNPETVRSLLNLLELHKKEADLIVSLRSTIASIQATLARWDIDVATLIAKNNLLEEKITRSIDFGAIKEINKPRGNK